MTTDTSPAESLLADLDPDQVGVVTAFEADAAQLDNIIDGDNPLAGNYVLLAATNIAGSTGETTTILAIPAEGTTALAAELLRAYSKTILDAPGTDTEAGVDEALRQLCNTAGALATALLSGFSPSEPFNTMAHIASAGVIDGVLAAMANEAAQAEADG